MGSESIEGWNLLTLGLWIVSDSFGVVGGLCVFIRFWC